MIIIFNVLATSYTINIQKLIQAAMFYPSGDIMFVYKSKASVAIMIVTSLSNSIFIVTKSNYNGIGSYVYVAI